MGTETTPKTEKPKTEKPKAEKPKAEKKSADKGKKASGAAKKPSPKKPASSKGKSPNGKVKRLKPGELDGLVIAYMRDHEKELPLSPTKIANGINRSSGAVGNCLERLAKADPPKARLAKKAPRAYDLKEVTAR